MLRRTLVLGGLAAVGLAYAGRGSVAKGSFEVSLSDAEWRARLSPDAYAVLRQGATERPFSSPLEHEAARGTFHCAGCDLPLYASGAKFDSGTGWPSFWASLPDAVRNQSDFGIFGLRVEEHCRRCGGHLGHVFADGPPPTGQRHCINGVALQFRAA